ncbi:hypothetical protein KC957_01655 [Candidatus Saccharibacteria bacterium]|nr:hypothetical protein [Candidatus Saccharibacteria bacterium]
MITITARLVVKHHEERLAAERSQAGPLSELMSVVTEAWGSALARRFVRYNFDNDQASTTFPLPSHLLAQTALNRLASKEPGRATPAQIKAGQAAMALIAPIDDTPHMLEGAARTGSYCADAEPKFVGALRQLAAGQAIEGDDYASHERISVYHAPDGTALALRKQRTDSTALLLEPVSINGSVTAPVGTIVDVVGTTECTGQAELRDGTRLASYQVTDETQLSPLRISPWAHTEPLDRALFGVEAPSEHVYVDLARAREVAGVAPSDFQNAASQIMAMCGVNC